EMKLFTDQQYRGLLILLPIAIVLVAIAVALELLPDAEQIEVADLPAKQEVKVVNEAEVEEVVFKEFDPNKFSYEELREAGLPKEVAVGVVRWRSYGKVYRVKEDLALVSGMTDSLYAVLKPFIVIDPSVAAKPKEYERKERAEYFAEKSQPEQSQLPKTDSLSKPKPAKEEPSFAHAEPLVELNSADTTALISVRGIGSKSAAEIVKYRDLLGGYHSVEQISELKCVTEQNYEKILQQIYCDSCEIRKIDINFAAPKVIARHPYVSAAALRKIIKQRQLKGGWSRIEEMVEDNILSEDEAKRLAPYLWFRLDATE
ncbi:MAG: helix-hairpin-helix domain-containing protein, partial [Alistipes sp.]|nr:helix-hairpin-helix domain-containing protein [Alistipes sp.]